MLVESDSLFNLRTRYYIGDFNGALEEAKQLKSIAPELAAQRNTFIFRCLFSQGKYDDLLSRVNEQSSPTACQLLRVHCALKLKGVNEVFLEKLKELCDVSNLDQNSRAVGCSIYTDLGDFRSAYKLVAKGDMNLELYLAKIQLLLAMNLLSEAKKDYEQMENLNDDDPLTQLANVWIMLREGKHGDDAYIALDELTSKGSGNSTPMIQNLKTVARMQEGAFDEALREAEECQELLSQGQGDKDQLRISLTNQINCLLHLGKTSDAGSTFKRLKKDYPGCAYLKKYEELSKTFDRFAANYKFKTKS